MPDASSPRRPDERARRAPLLMPRLLGRLLPPATQDIVRRAGYNRTVRKGEQLVGAGDLVEDIYFFHAGWFASSIGRCVANIYGPGDLFLISLDAAVARSPGELRALTAGSIAVVPRMLARELTLAAPDIALFVANQALNALVRARIFHTRRNTDPLDVRLAHVLWTLAERREDGLRQVVTDLPQAEIASFLGVTREEVSRKRKLLIRAGYLIERDGEWFMDAGTPLLLASNGCELAADVWYQGVSRPTTR